SATVRALRLAGPATPVIDTLSLHDALPIYHAAVSETIGALRRAGGGRASGLVNAVLRRAAEQDRDAWIAQLTQDLPVDEVLALTDRKSTRLNSSHVKISYAVFCLKKKNNA